MNEDEAAQALEGMYAEDAPEAETETNTETPEVEQTQTAEPVAEGAEAPEATEEAEDEPSQDNEIDWTQFLPQPANVPAPEPDEDGQINVAELIQYQLNQKLAEQTNEIRGWQQVSQILPDVNTNPQLREFVNNQRLAAVATGGNGDLVSAAKVVKDIIGNYESKGKAQAQTSVQIQKAAAVQGGDPTTPAATPQNDAFSNLASSGSVNDAQDLFSAWIDEGKI